MNAASSHARLRAAIDADRDRIARGERPVYHAAWSTAADGSIDVTIRELPLIHQFVPDEAGVLDGARFLIARHLEADPGSFDVAPSAGAPERPRRRADPQAGGPLPYAVSFPSLRSRPVGMMEASVDEQRNNLANVLEAWRETERATERARAAVEAAKRAADAARNAADAASETAHSAQETLRSAERARDVASEAARAAVAASGAADRSSDEAIADLDRASVAMDRAKDAFHAAQNERFSARGDTSR